MEYDDDQFYMDEDEEKKYRAIQELRKDYGPPEDYPKYNIDGIIICTN
jgi:hypothetical protein